MRYIVLFVISLFVACSAISVAAQDNDNKKLRQLLRKGNRQYHKGQREKAIISYQKALSLDSTNAKVLYNLATSLIPEEFWRPWPQRVDSLREKEVRRIDGFFLQSAERETNPLKKSKSFYNQGVLHQSLYQSSGKDEQQLIMAIEAYKNALRNNPADEEARYNLVVCQRQLKKKQRQQPKNDQQQNDSTQNQQQQQQNDSTKQQQPPQQQQPPHQQPMEQQRMDQMLQNAMQKEKETQRRVKEAEQQQRTRRSNRKNW